DFYFSRERGNAAIFVDVKTARGGLILIVASALLCETPIRDRGDEQARADTLHERAARGAEHVARRLDELVALDFDGFEIVFHFAAPCSCVAARSIARMMFG